jgi:hypothetical protein
MAHNQTQCFDLFEIKGTASFILPLIVSCTMTVTFVLILLWATVRAFRTCCEVRKDLTFRKTRVMFNLCLIVYSLGRTVFYAIGIVLKGYSEHEHSSQSYILYIVNTISNLIYQMTSCFYYTAFCILTVYWSQNLLLAYGMAQKTINKSLRRSKLLIYTGNVVLAVIQIIISIAVIILIIALRDKRSPSIPILMSCDLIYQSVLIVLLILFFIVWYRYVHSKLDTRFVVVNMSDFDEMKKTRNATIVVSIIITLKLVWNIFSVYMHLAHRGLCMDDRYLIVAVVDLICDCIPLGLVGLFLGPKTREQSRFLNSDTKKKKHRRGSDNYSLFTDGSPIAFFRSDEDEDTHIHMEGTQRALVVDESVHRYGTI